MPDDVGVGDALGAAVADFCTDGAVADETDAGTAVRCGCGRAFGVRAGCGLREFFGDVLVEGRGARAWTRPTLGSPLALDGA
ncbi:MAG TPA: hypothetical protein VME44_05715 [Streptosporangiaceae bacterium]|nr:hypothetical protein [Streptosporangiaceae bacterium]